MSWVNDYQPLKLETLDDIENTLQRAENTNEETQGLLDDLSSNVEEISVDIGKAKDDIDQLLNLVTSEEAKQEFTNRILKVGLKKAICCSPVFVEGKGYLPKFSEEIYPELVGHEEDPEFFAAQSIWFIISEIEEEEENPGEEETFNP